MLAPLLTEIVLSDEIMTTMSLNQKFDELLKALAKFLLCKLYPTDQLVSMLEIKLSLPRSYKVQ